MVGLDPGLGRVTNRIVLTHFTGRTTHHTNGSLTPRISSNNAPQPDGALNNADRNKVLHYRHLYADLSDPIVLLTVVVNTLGQLYDDFLEPSFVILECSVSGELTEESDTAFCSLRISASAIQPVPLPPRGVLLTDQIESWSSPREGFSFTYQFEY
jgi:hypothetical protein